MEMEAEAPTRAQRRVKICQYVFFGAIGLLLASALLWYVYQEITYKQPNYTVAIAAVSGLDPATDLGRRPVLDPEFNVTVGVTQRSPLAHWCDDSNTTVRVSYHGFELASAVAPEVCVSRGTWTVIARGSHVWLPGPAVDSLAADIRHAAGVFDVVITIPKTASTRAVYYGLVVSCMRRCVGQDAGDGALCDVRGEHYVKRSAH